MRDAKLEAFAAEIQAQAMTAMIVVHGKRALGAIGVSDFLTMRAGFGGAPGPSGLDCAGEIPCLGR